MKIRIALLLVALALATGAAAVWWFHRAMWGSTTQAEIMIEVEPGSSARSILDDLEARGALQSALAARLYLRGWGRDRNLHFGRYDIAAGQRGVDVLERLLEGRVEMLSVTIVEGSDAAEIGAAFASAGVGTTSRWRELYRRVDWVADLAPEAPSLEGFLFPDTYRFAIGTPPGAAARHLVDRFLDVWREESAGVDLWASPLEIVTLASMVEAETSLGSERGVIAGVFFNRLRRGMLLQCDPTVVFALKRNGQWSGRLLRIHWQFDDPYNTYLYAGLPPGPINSPGRAAIAAAVQPETTPHMYFVARPGGGHTFSRT
ncbi:MAG: endolytic transglycosylase MltG, partial [Holophagae bacterium]